jgi:hypothetical protein
MYFASKYASTYKSTNHYAMLSFPAVMDLRLSHSDKSRRLVTPAQAGAIVGPEANGFPLARE